MNTDVINRRIFKVVDKFITVMAVLSALILISYIVTGLTSGKQAVLGYRVMWVRTASMEPTIMTGDFVLTKIAEKSELEIGDIAVYRKADSFGHPTSYRIIHRIIGTTDEGDYIFKGDNNPEPDRWSVRPEQVEYKVIKVF